MCPNLKTTIMKKIYFLFLSLLIGSVSFGQLVINEIDADTPGPDIEEFIELKWTPNTSLSGYIVVLFNGSNDLSYATFDLNGKTTDADGFFILANTPLIIGSDIDLGANNILQNGADAVTIYQASAASFPMNTAVTMTGLVDALVYDSSDADDPELLSGLGETVQYDENANAASATQSIQRKTDGTYETKTVTFRVNNDAVCDLSLSIVAATCDASTTGTDTYTATITFSGGGNSNYTINSTLGTVGGDDPSSFATGTITITGVAEGTDVTVTVGNGALCDLSTTVTSPNCDPSTPLPLFENFNYGSIPGELTAVSGGNWTVHSGAGAVAYTTTSLSMPGYSSSGIGGSIMVEGALGEDVNHTFNKQTTGIVYFSALVNISAATTTGNYFFHLKDATTGFRGRVAAKDNGTGNIRFGIATSTTTYVYGTTPFSLNTTYLLVASYNITSGVSNLYVLTAPVVTEPATPEASDTGTAGTIISAVALRQTSGIPTANVDGINVATSWTSVLSTNEFRASTSFRVFPNPTSVGFVNITSYNTGSMSVKIFDVLGKQVLNQTVNNNRLNLSTLNSGIYIMKITQNNATVIKKLVIN